jgi:hypothetical protein
MGTHFISARDKLKGSENWNYYYGADFFAKLENDAKSLSRADVDAATQAYLARGGVVSTRKVKERGERVRKTVAKEVYQSEKVVTQELSTLDYSAGVGEIMGAKRKNIFDMLA